MHVYGTVLHRGPPPPVLIRAFFVLFCQLKKELAKQNQKRPKTRAFLFVLSAQKNTKLQEPRAPARSALRNGEGPHA